MILTTLTHTERERTVVGVAHKDITPLLTHPSVYCAKNITERERERERREQEKERKRERYDDAVSIVRHRSRRRRRRGRRTAQNGTARESKRRGKIICSHPLPQKLRVAMDVLGEVVVLIILQVILYF